MYLKVLGIGIVMGFDIRKKGSVRMVIGMDMQEFPKNNIQTNA